MKNQEDSSGITIRNATADERRQIDEILRILPDAVLQAAGVREIEVRDLGATHGLTLENGRIVIAPKMFAGGVKTMLGHGQQWPHLYFTVVHEIGHALDDKYRISRSEDWLQLSGWRHEPETIGKKSPAGRGRYVEKRPGWDDYTSPWTHDEEGQPFIRQYAHKGPEDDWADTWAYYWLSPRAFTSEKLRQKYAFIEDVVDQLKYDLRLDFSGGLEDENAE